MSALTKIFVVLHVIVSLMLASAVIVWANRQEPYKAEAALAKQKAAAAEQHAALVQQDIAKVVAQKLIAEQELSTQIVDAQAQVAQKAALVDAANVEVSKQKSLVDQLTVQLNSLAGQLDAKDKQVVATIAANTGIKATLDDMVKKYSDDERAITRLTNERNVVSKHDKYLVEVNTDLQTQLTQANEALRKYGVPVGGAAPDKPVLNSVPNVNINGVVRDYRTINGVPWATISLGSADAVTVGMKFNVVEGGKFLGYLVVEAVNTHDATGYLQGPLVTQVRPNVSEVRTQLN